MRLSGLDRVVNPIASVPSRASAWLWTRQRCILCFIDRACDHWDACPVYGVCLPATQAVDSLEPGCDDQEGRVLIYRGSQTRVAGSRIWSGQPRSSLLLLWAILPRWRRDAVPQPPSLAHARYGATTVLVPQIIPIIILLFFSMLSEPIDVKSSVLAETGACSTGILVSRGSFALEPKALSLRSSGLGAGRYPR